VFTLDNTVFTITVTPMQVVQCCPVTCTCVGGSVLLCSDKALTYTVTIDNRIHPHIHPSNTGDIVERITLLNMRSPNN